MDEPRNGQTTEAMTTARRRVFAGPRDPIEPVGVHRVLAVVGLSSGIVMLSVALGVGVAEFLRTGTVRPEELAVRLLLAVVGFWVAAAVSIALTTRHERAWTNAWLGHIVYYDVMGAGLLTMTIAKEPHSLLFRGTFVLVMSAVLGAFQAVGFPFSRLFQAPASPKPPAPPPDDLYDPALDGRR